MWLCGMFRPSLGMIVHYWTDVARTGPRLAARHIPARPGDAFSTHHPGLSSASALYTPWRSGCTACCNHGGATLWYNATHSYTMYMTTGDRWLLDIEETLSRGRATGSAGLGRDGQQHDHELRSSGAHRRFTGYHRPTAAELGVWGCFDGLRNASQFAPRIHQHGSPFASPAHHQSRG